MSRLMMLNVGTALRTEECYSCHVLFALPESLYQELVRQKAHRSFYCPNGHSQHYVGEREEDTLRRELEQKQRELDWEIRHSKRLAEDNMDLAKSNRTLKGSVTKLKKRAAAGVCAFCHRHFANMQRHVETKHPEAASAAEVI